MSLTMKLGKCFLLISNLVYLEMQTYIYCLHFVAMKVLNEKNDNFHIKSVFKTVSLIALKIVILFHFNIKK